MSLIYATCIPHMFIVGICHLVKIHTCTCRLFNLMSPLKWNKSVNHVRSLKANSWWMSSYNNQKPTKFQAMPIWLTVKYISWGQDPSTFAYRWQLVFACRVWSCRNIGNKTILMNCNSIDLMKQVKSFNLNSLILYRVHIWFTSRVKNCES